MRNQRILGHVSAKEYEDRHMHENTKDVITKNDFDIHIMKIKRKVARDKFCKVLEKRLLVRNAYPCKYYYMSNTPSI